MMAGRRWNLAALTNAEERKVKQIKLPVFTYVPFKAKGQEQGDGFRRRRWILRNAPMVFDGGCCPVLSCVVLSVWFGSSLIFGIKTSLFFLFLSLSSSFLHFINWKSWTTFQMENSKRKCSAPPFKLQKLVMDRRTNVQCRCVSGGRKFKYVMGIRNGLQEFRMASWIASESNYSRLQKATAVLLSNFKVQVRNSGIQEWPPEWHHNQIIAYYRKQQQNNYLLIRVLYVSV